MAHVFIDGESVDPEEWLWFVRGQRILELLEGCDHCFCLECLREWRNTHAIRPEVARSCPECRAPSHFVTPSAVHLTADRKRLLILAYQKARC